MNRRAKAGDNLDRVAGLLRWIWKKLMLSWYSGWRSVGQSCSVRGICMFFTYHMGLLSQLKNMQLDELVTLSCR